MLAKQNHMRCSTSLGLREMSIKAMMKYHYIGGDPRWRRSKYKLQQDTPRTSLDLQLNCKEIIQNKQLNNSRGEALYLCTVKRNSLTTT